MADKIVRTKHFVNLMSQIVEFRHDDTFCDVDVIVGSKVFKCHRLVLSAASKYFYVKLKRIMFDEGRSCATTEITLPKTAEADLFELILEFIYTGYVAIHRSNVYDLIRAANYYKVPSIVELCTKFVEDNLNVLAEDVSILLALAHGKRVKQLEVLLSAHVRKNFGHVDEFSKFTSENVAPISDTKPTNGPIILNEARTAGVQSRVNPQQDATSQIETPHQFAQGEIDFDRTVAQLAAQIGVTSDRVPGAGVQLPGKLLHAYVSRINRWGSPIGTSIYTWSPTENITTPGNIYPMWKYTDEMDYLSTYMRSVCIDDRLYSLNYLSDPPNQIDDQQTFRCSNSISMDPSQSLSPPPYYLSEFDLCGTRNHIYVCTKYCMPVPRSTGDLSEIELSQGLFGYKRDLDMWFPLPSPTRRCWEGCMTCNDDEIVYLIGGQNSDGTVQVYDPRLPEWFSLTPGTAGRYRGAACCAYGQKIYVAGGSVNPHMVEVYDPVAGDWQRLRNLEVYRMKDHQLVNWDSPIPSEHNRIVCFDQPLFHDSTIEHLNPETNLPWSQMPDLYMSVVSEPGLFFDLLLLDMINV